MFFQDTEVLTDNSWRRFSELEPEDKVASLVGGEELKFVKPTAYFRWVWKGNLIHFYGRNLDFCITPGHRMLVKRRDRKHGGRLLKKNFEFVKALDVKKRFRVKRSAIWCGGRDVQFFRVPLVKYNKWTRWLRKEIVIGMKDWLRFFGLWLAEGAAWGKVKPGYYRITVAQKKKRREVEEILDRLPLRYSYSGMKFKIYNKSLYYFLKPLTGSLNKQIPKEFRNLSSEYLRALLEGYLLGDGYITESGMKGANTISKQLADDLQEVGIKLGYAVSLKKYKRSNPNWHDVYTLSFIESQVIAGIWHKEELYYEGRVYSVQVPSHIILVRRCGLPAWCGT